MPCCLSSLSGSSSCSWDVGMLMNHLDHLDHLEIVGSNRFITNNDDDNNDDDHHHHHNNNKVQTLKFFFKTVENSMDALKEHQANSKISSGSLFWGPQSLFVPPPPPPPPTTTTTTITTTTTTTTKTKTKGGCLRNWDSTNCTSILHPNQVARLLLHPFEVPVLHIRGLKVWGDLGGVPDPAVASHLLMPWYSRRRILIYLDMLSPFAFDMFIFCHALTVLTCVDPSLQDPGW